MPETERIRELRRSATAGGPWYEGPQSIEEGHFSFTVMVAAPGDHDLTALEFDFDWTGYAFVPFREDISEEEDSIMGSSPVAGWAAWSRDDLVVAYRWMDLSLRVAG